MSLTALMAKPCTITNRTESGSRNQYGRDEPAETTVDTVCDLQQVSRDEEDDHGELSDTHWLLILPTGTEIRSGDSVEVEGQTFEMVGDPWDATQGSPDMHHVEATLRRTVGTGVAS